MHAKGYRIFGDLDQLKIKRYYAKIGGLIPTAKRGKEINQSTVFCKEMHGHPDAV